MKFEKENDNRRGDRDPEEQTDQGDEQHQAVHWGAKLDACSGYSGNCDCTV